MSNSYFQFKQFTVHQELCAMKVSTDACILGAWVNVDLGKKRGLDIGCGTGVLSLMLAQKSNEIKIHAIDLDKDAVQQANQNFLNSKFANQLSAQQTALQEFESGTQYDVIISNPPYFENSLLSSDAQLNYAKHESGLTLTELFLSVNKLLANDGQFYIVLPIHRYEDVEQQCLKYNLQLQQVMRIRHSADKAITKFVASIHRHQSKTIFTELVIKDEHQAYSKHFTELMKDYYLHL
jgi:tRNA1Val (adenine37-N6)-methyltransferase